MYRFVISAFMLFGSVAQAQTTNLQTLTYESVTANAPAGISRLRLTQVDSSTYAVDFSIVAPNRTQHRGHIQGLATRGGNRLVLRVPNFREDGSLELHPLCTLVIDAHEGFAKVVSEHQCSGLHGAGASFVEQGKNLLHVP